MPICTLCITCYWKHQFTSCGRALEAAKDVGGEGTVAFNSGDEGVIAKIVQHCATEGGVCWTGAFLNKKRHLIPLPSPSLCI